MHSHQYLVWYVTVTVTCWIILVSQAHLLSSVSELLLKPYEVAAVRTTNGQPWPLPMLTTNGLPWPLPMNYSTESGFQNINKKSFRFRTVGYTCDILEEAYIRYYRIIFGDIHSRRTDNSGVVMFSLQQQKLLSTLTVKVLNECDKYPSLQMDESYELVVKPGMAVLISRSVWGALRGLETFAQLIYENPSGILQINDTVIVDAPRFPWRGLLLDSSRHYLSLDVIKRNLEAMAYNKFNVFHWHIVDDQSFPYQSKRFPEMSLKGAYHPYTHVYTQADVSEVIEFARVRGIRVIPEFDSPGHTMSWGRGIEGLLTKCFNHGVFSGDYGPIDPSQNSTYDFLWNFFGEIVKVFPDNYVHLGGDEVYFNCWKSNPNITEFMKKIGFGDDYAKLEEYYIQTLIKLMQTLNSSYVVWQEVFDNKVEVNKDTVIEVWKSGYEEELSKVTATQLKAILSSPWYLSYFTFGDDWKKFYVVNPTSFNGTTEQKSLVIGGEVCMWGEYADNTNVESRLWPRASAIAERLWSPESVTDVNKAAGRLQEHRCRMVRRGVRAESIDGPGYCKHEYSDRLY